MYKLTRLHRNKFFAHFVPSAGLIDLSLHISLPELYEEFTNIINEMICMNELLTLSRFSILKINEDNLVDFIICIRNITLINIVWLISLNFSDDCVPRKYL